MISTIFANLQDDKICQVSYRCWQSAHYRGIVQNPAHPPPPTLNCGRSFPNQIRIFPRVEVSLPFQRGISAKGASLEIYCTEKIWKVLYNVVAASRKSYKPTTILIMLVVFGLGYCTQSTPFQASEKQGTAVGLEIGQPGKFVETLGVLWFQSPKMARNAFTAAEDTIKHYSHVCSNILEHFEEQIPHLQTLGMDSPSNSYNWKNELLEYVYIYREIN